MSAHIVSDTHISAMIQAATMSRWAKYRWKGDWCEMMGKRQELGQKLIDENYRSVNHRYGENYQAHEFMMQRVSRHTPVQIIRLCDGYNYQACETPDWKETEAYTIVQAIREQAIHNLPGYEEAAFTL